MTFGITPGSSSPGDIKVLGYGSGTLTSATQTALGSIVFPTLTTDTKVFIEIYLERTAGAGAANRFDLGNAATDTTYYNNSGNGATAHTLLIGQLNNAGTQIAGYDIKNNAAAGAGNLNGFAGGATLYISGKSDAGTTIRVTWCIWIIKTDVKA